MFYSPLVSTTKFSDIELQFARLLTQIATTGVADAECRQYVHVIAAHYGIKLESADCLLSREAVSHLSDEAYVIEQLKLSKEELIWSSLDELKLNNQARQLQQLHPLKLDGSRGNCSNRDLYPSSRDYIRWEVMRNQGLITS